MHGQHIAEVLLLIVIVIPINGDDILGQGVLVLLGNLLTGHKIFTVVPSVEQHIRPDHGLLIAVLGGKLVDASEVVLHDLSLGTGTVDILVLTAAQEVCLVHADVQSARAEAGGKGLEHAVDQEIDALVARQHNIGIVEGMLTPSGQGFLMGKSLDAGDSLHTDGSAELVNLLHLGDGIAAAHITEVRLVDHLIGVLHVKKHHIVAHLAHNGQKAL